QAPIRPRPIRGKVLLAHCFRPRICRDYHHVSIAGWGLRMDLNHAAAKEPSPLCRSHILEISSRSVEAPAHVHRRLRTNELGPSREVARAGVRLSDTHVQQDVLGI